MARCINLLPPGPISHLPRGELPGTTHIESLASPPLMVSDNPERVTFDTSPGVLWQHTIFGNPSGAHRVFMWHLNNLKVPPSSQLAVTVENINPTVGGFTINVGTVRAATCESPDYLQAGTNLALPLLNDDLPVYTSIATPIAPQSTAPIYIADWAVSGLRPVQLDFQISPDVGAPLSSLTYVVRTVYTPVPFTAWDSLNSLKPEDLDGTHPRGSWPFSEARASCSFEIQKGAGPAPPLYFMLTEPTAFTTGASNSEQCKTRPCTEPNKAAYGAIVHVSLAVNNKDGCAHRFQLSLSSDVDSTRGESFAAAYARRVDSAGVTAAAMTAKLKNSIEAYVLENRWEVEPGPPDPQNGFNIYKFIFTVPGAASTPVRLHAQDVG